MGERPAANPQDGTGSIISSLRAANSNPMGERFERQSQKETRIAETEKINAKIAELKKIKS